MRLDISAICAWSSSTVVASSVTVTLAIASLASYSGISPCFLGGRSSRLVCRYSSTCAT